MCTAWFPTASWSFVGSAIKEAHYVYRNRECPAAIEHNKRPPPGLLGSVRWGMMLGRNHEHTVSAMGVSSISNKRGPRKAV